MCGIISSSSTLFPQTNNTVNWNGNNSAISCVSNNNGPNNQLNNVLTSGSNCRSVCANTKGCTHFSWSSYIGGTRFMKQGSIKQSNAVLISNPSSVCGVL